MAPDDDTNARCPDCGGALAAEGDECPCRQETAGGATVVADDLSGATRTDEGSVAGGGDYGGPKEIAGYRILRELGSGGMASVYLADDEKMHRKVALKLLARHLAPSFQAGKRFEHEAWIAGRLDHPNLVKVYDRGHWEDISYFSMELVDGGSLHDVVENLRRSGRDERYGLVFGTREYVLWAITQVVAAARGLDYAHRHGVVHRDVKPLNLLLSKEHKTVKVADFGLAIDEQASRLTATGTMLGTVSYMAPEQLLGKKHGIGPATDVYALGVTLFELLTLKLPYAAATQQLYMSAVLTGEVRRASKFNVSVSGDLETVLRKALEKDPADRYAAAAALADDLENVLDFRPITARPPSRRQRVLKWIRRKPMHAALLATLLVGVPLIGGLGYRAVGARRVIREARVEKLWKEISWLAQSSRHLDVLRQASAILHIAPRHVPATRARALSHFRLAQRAATPEEAANLTDSALRDLDRVIELVPQAAWPHRMRAFFLRSLGRQDEAAAEDALAAALIPVEPSDDDLYFDAFVAEDDNDYRRAIALYSQLIERRPNNREAIARRARAYTTIHEETNAIIDYRVSMALDPADYYALFDMGQLHTRIREFDAADRYLRRALELEPGSVYVHEALAHNFSESGKAAAAQGDRAAALSRFRSAEAESRQAIEARPDLPWGHINLGASLVEQSRVQDQPAPALIDDAVDQFEQALAIVEAGTGVTDVGALSMARVNLCDGLIQKRDLTRAAEVCLAVAKLHPDSDIAFYNLAGVYALQDRPDDALRALERDFKLGDRDHGYLARDPWFESLRQDPRFRDLIERMKAAD